MIPRAKVQSDTTFFETMQRVYDTNYVYIADHVFCASQFLLGESYRWQAFNIALPEGFGAGDPIEVCTPDGQTLQITVRPTRLRMLAVNVFCSQFHCSN